MKGFYINRVNCWLKRERTAMKPTPEHTIDEFLTVAAVAIAAALVVLLIVS